MAKLHPPQSLDDLLARAEDFARFSMRARGQVPPALLALGPAGPLFFVPAALADERAKDNFANTARLICVAHAATAAVMILEAWMKTAAPDGSLDLSVPPSESLLRREIVLLTGESRAGVQQKILPIIRTGAGGFFGFGEFDGPSATSFQGRFAQIPPPRSVATGPPIKTPADRRKELSSVLVIWVQGRRRLVPPHPSFILAPSLGHPGMILARSKPDGSVTFF